MENIKSSTDQNKTKKDRYTFFGDLALVSAINLFQLIKLGSLSGHLIKGVAENQDILSKISCLKYIKPL